ncbi:GMP synthase [glutamine-hydrolyzing] [Striga asiatica]|uniref:GMP synthase [glutamine-hydrolyzing] n=1 Tax=Striga asiatica TaxID=4170 RepID=A0A5A7PEF4_STRAF|nr:GMP synthase [glutamine-hydrolyzing] [Striga asiatica]
MTEATRRRCCCGGGELAGKRRFAGKCCCCEESSRMVQGLTGGRAAAERDLREVLRLRMMACRLVAWVLAGKEIIAAEDGCAAELHGEEEAAGGVVAALRVGRQRRRSRRLASGGMGVEGLLEICDEGSRRCSRRLPEVGVVLLAKMRSSPGKTLRDAGSRRRWRRRVAAICSERKTRKEALGMVGDGSWRRSQLGEWRLDLSDERERREDFSLLCRREIEG